MTITRERGRGSTAQEPRIIESTDPELLELSVVLPVYNEEGNLVSLTEELVTVLDAEWDRWEVIFVDDGSRDASFEVLQSLHEEDDRIKVVQFRRNFGQSPALDAGLDFASGEIIVTMDSDRQNDPADIPQLVEKLDEGYDCISGWRRDRDDPATKRFFSRLASGMRRLFLGTDLHDYGCTLKAFRRQAAKDIELYGEMHRYIPALLSWRGYRIGEIEVNHRPRQAGETKYSWQRLPKGFMDLVNVWFWQKFSGRPLHVFGGLGIVSIGLGVLAGFLAFVQVLTSPTTFSDTALTLLAVFMVMIGVQFFISGILADIGIKGYQHAKNEEPYRVREVLD